MQFFDIQISRNKYVYKFCILLYFLLYLERNCLIDLLRIILFNYQCCQELQNVQGQATMQFFAAFDFEITWLKEVQGGSFFHSNFSRKKANMLRCKLGVICIGRRKAANNLKYTNKSQYFGCRARAKNIWQTMSKNFKEKIFH